MADAIQNRKQNQEYIRQLQQDKSERKKELAERSKEEMKALKATFQEENKQIDSETTAAINHIQARAEEDGREEKLAKIEKAATYNRKAVQNSENRAQAQQSSVDGKSLQTERPSNALTQKTTNHDADDFYKVQDRGSSISERSDGYVIEAYAPEKEKDNLRMSVQSGKAILSGKRKFQDQVEEGQKKISTNNFQTYHEEFKFDRPVASEGMTRERSGDFVRFFIPKLESLRFDEES